LIDKVISSFKWVTKYKKHKKDMPKITVLMPVFNCELYIQEAVESILNQTYTDFEFLILDDASTDQTVSIIKKCDDPRIQLIEKPLNTGYTNSLNYGLTIAKGKYIARMDGDDISFPERFAKQVSCLEANPDVVLCGTSYKIIGNDKKLSFPENHDAIKLALLRGNCIAHPSVMIRKKILDDFSIIYDTTKEPAEDYDMWVRLLSIGKLHIIQDVLLEYRIYNTQVSRKRAEEQKKNDVEIKFQLLNYLDIIIEADERDFLTNFFKEKETIDFRDIKIFKQLQKKLFKSNVDGFFEPIGFKQYLIDLEGNVVRKCFLKQKRYSPLQYFEYLKTKYKWNAGLTTKNELKLLIKSVLFWKI
jgi:glycosyltransferase involved in cell wall biosynthesis